MKFRKGYKNQLTETETLQTEIYPEKDIVTRFITLTTSGLLTIQWGYAWDGASGPTFDDKIGWGWFSVKLTDTNVPSCVHDALAQLMRLGLLEQKWLDPVNALLDKMLKARGMTWMRRRIWRRGLWLTAGSFADPKNVKTVYESF